MPTATPFKCTAGRGTVEASCSPITTETHVPPEPVLTDVIAWLDVLRAAARGDAPWPGASADVAVLPAEKAPGSTVLHGDAPACRAVPALVDAIVSVLHIHTARRATQPAVPARCRHDGKTWPCPTVQALVAALARAEGDPAA